MTEILRALQVDQYQPTLSEIKKAIKYLFNHQSEYMPSFERPCDRFCLHCAAALNSSVVINDDTEHYSHRTPLLPHDCHTQSLIRLLKDSMMRGKKYGE